MRQFLAAGLAALAFYIAPAAAVDPNLEWYTLEGAHFTVDYHQGEAALAAHVLDVAEDEARILDPWLKWQPEGKVELVLTDHVDLPNGLTTPFPRNNVQLYVTPPDSLDTLEDYDDWVRLLISHEYTHTLQLDKVTGLPASLRKVFGRNFWLFPGVFQPTLLVEGIAVYDETDAAAGVGRGQSSLYAMYMRAEVARGVRPWSQVTMSGVRQWPGGSLPYLYGVNFYQFLDQTYGRDSIPRLVDNYSDNLIPFLANSNLEGTYGEARETIRGKFTQYLQQRYGAPPYPAGTTLVEGERLTHDGYGTSSPKAAADGSVFYVRDDERRQPAIMVWRPGQGSRELAPVFTPARLDWNAEAGLLVARPEVCEEYHLDFDLYRVDPVSGDTTRLTECGRYHYGTWSPDGTHIAASRIALGQSSLVLLKADGSDPQTLWAGTDGVILGALDWSPDGQRIVAALWRPGRRWGLEEFDLATGSWRTLVEGVGAVGDPEYTRDGRAVLFTADAGGVYNLRQVERDTGAVTTLTRVATGAFAPTQGAPGADIYYLGYTADGYDLYRLPVAAARDDALTARTAPPPSRPAPPPAKGETHPYSAWPGILPAYWAPEFLFAPDTVQLGAITTGQDSRGVHLYSADVHYEFTHHLTGGSLLYSYADRLQFLAARMYEVSSGSDTLYRIRRDDRLEVLWQRPWTSLERSLTFSIGATGDERRDRYDAGFVEPDTRDATAGIAFKWDSVKDWPISISHDDGRYVTFVAESSNVIHNDYRGNALRLDWSEYLRTGDQSVLFLRWLEGYGTEGIQPYNLGGATDPGLGTPAAELLFDRRSFAFPGYPGGLSQLAGRRMRLASISWRLPVAQPEAAFDSFPLGAHAFSLRMYLDAGGTWDTGGRPARYARSAGVEWVSDLNLLYLVDLRLVTGVAHGFDSGGENQAYATLEFPLP